MDSHTIRIPSIIDLGRIKELLVASGMYTEDEAPFFEGMLSGALNGSLEDDIWIVVENGAGLIVGTAMVAPELLADRMWHLHIISVDPSEHRTGLGRYMVTHLEADLKERGEAHARTLVIDTSSTDQYAGARRFYASLGFVEEARIREYYGPDQHKVIFWKSLI